MGGGGWASTRGLRPGFHPGANCGLTFRLADPRSVVTVNETPRKEPEMSSGLIIGILVGLWVLVRVVGRQITGSLVTQRQLMLMPAILLVLGVLSLSSALDGASAGELAFLGLDCVVLIGLGLARGASIRLERREEGLFQKGTAATLGLWVLTIALRVGAAFGSAAIWPDSKLGLAALALTIGLTIAAQNAMIYRRALNLRIPFAVDRA